MTTLDQAITPAAVVEALAMRGVVISERALREKARRAGTCRVIGRAMFFLPEDIEQLLEAMKPTPTTLTLRGVPHVAQRGSALNEARAKLKELKARRK